VQRAETYSRAEAGFSLVEVLVGVSLLALVLGAVMTPLIISQRAETRTVNYDWAQQAGRGGLDSMVAEIRQATSFVPSGNAVVITVTLQGVPLTVEYECDVPQPGSTIYRECLRVQVAQGTTLPSINAGSIVLQNLLNGTDASPVFTWGPDPNAPYYMTASIQVPASTGASVGLSHSITLSDGALMRNLNVGN
jgi:type II secretory pathway pseudopilin PulG